MYEGNGSAAPAGADHDELLVEPASPLKWVVPVALLVVVGLIVAVMLGRRGSCGDSGE